MTDTQTPTPGPSERQPAETAKAFEAFRAYLEMGPARSTAKVARQLGKSKTLIDRWSSRWSWPDRVRRFESSETTEKDGAHLQALADRSKRQAQIAQLHGEATALVARAVVQKVADNPQALNGLDLEKLLALEATMARAHARIVPTERLALGMTTDQPGEPAPRAQAEEMARRMSEAELDERLTGIDQVAAQREKRERRAAS